MKFIRFIALTFLFFVSAAQSSEITSALEPFQPINVVNNDGTLIIVTNESRVTSNIYSAIINNGVCMPIWLGNKDALSGITKIQVLNKFQKQGYVFDGGKEVCDTLGEQPQKQNEIFLMGHSSIY